MIKVGVVGATGYTGEELIEVLLRNPEAKITYMASRVEKDTDYASLYPRLGKRITVPLRNIDVDKIAAECELVFLALPHTVSMGIAPKFIEKGKKVIDLSADYRLPADKFEKWYAMAHTDVANLPKAVYGLPELNREKIKNARFISNPGCYPTSVILGLLPIINDVARNKSVIIVDSKSGVTGAGRKAITQLLFGEVAENFKSYKANEHQHIPEMEHVLSGVCGKDVQVNFTPHLLPIRRGILSTIYIKHDGLPPAQELYDKYAKMYAHEPFTRVSPYGEHPQVKDVAGTNFCDIGIKVSRGMVIIVSVIDNLLKGASGQAVQNMNIMYGIDERAGLI